MKSSFLTLPREFSRSIRMENSTRFGSGVMLPDSSWTGKNRYLSPRKGFRIHIEVLPLFASHTGHQDILHLNVRVKFRLVAQSPLYRTIQHVPFPALLELYVSIRLHRSFFCRRNILLGVRDGHRRHHSLHEQLGRLIRR